jgi:hypothetical protein
MRWSSGSVVATDVAFQSNECSLRGCGVYQVSASASYTRCTFTSNRGATVGGGGMYLASSGATTFTNWEFGRNGATQTDSNDMFQDSGCSLSFGRDCPNGGSTFGRQILRKQCSSTCTVILEYPANLTTSLCAGNASVATVTNQLELESAIQGDLLVVLDADIYLDSEVAVVSVVTALQGLVIDGRNKYKVDGRSQVRCFFIANLGTDVTFSNMTITNGRSDLGDYKVASGGAIWAGHGVIVTLVGTTVSNSTAVNGYGSGVYVGCSVTFSMLRGSSLQDNFGAVNGAGLYVASCTASSGKPTISLAGTTITRNSATQGGAGIYVGASYSGGNVAFSLISCTVSFNDVLSVGVDAASSFNGGGIYTGAYIVPTISACLIESNTGAAQGGGAYFGQSYTSVTITNCVVRENRALYRGGGIYLFGGGGSIYAHIFTNVKLLSNDGGNFGGGLYLNGYLTLTLNSWKFWGNKAVTITDIYQGTTGVAVFFNSGCPDGQTHFGHSVMNCPECLYTYPHNLTSDECQEASSFANATTQVGVC